MIASHPSKARTVIVGGGDMGAGSQTSGGEAVLVQIGQTWVLDPQWWRSWIGSEGDC